MKLSSLIKQNAMRNAAAFLLLLCLLAIGGIRIAAEPATSPKTPDEKTLYAVATAHLDTQWNWTIETSINEYIPKTLRENFALFEEFPHYVFSFEGAFRYMLMQEYYPSEFERLKQYVAQGRWRVAGSSVDAGDSNIVSPESLIRHVLYGNGYFGKTFGKTSLDIFLPDCFGFGYALPSVAAHCGLKGFSSQKLRWGATLIPFSIGSWIGPDGNSIVAVLQPGRYGTKFTEDPTTDTAMLKRIMERKSDTGLAREYTYYGVGDRGGAPTHDSAKWVEKRTGWTEPFRVFSTGSDQYFRDLTPEQIARLPRYQGELLLRCHGTGCYTSQAAMKRWNRRNELLADSAERASVAADWLGGCPYPLEFLNIAWVRFLWHQFHDDLTGTSIPAAYQFSWSDEALAENMFLQALLSSSGAVSRGLDTRGHGIPVIVYNPLSCERQDVVQANLLFPNGAPKALRVTGPDGREIAAQILRSDTSGTEFIFVADVAPVSWSVFDVVPEESFKPQDGDLKITKNSLENERYLVTLNENGDVAGIMDKAVGKELLDKPHRLEFFNDVSTRYPAWEIMEKDINDGPQGAVGGPAEIKIIEKGPVRVALEVSRQARGSTIVQRIRLAAGGAGDRVEFDTLADWKTRKALLKASFRTKASNEKATYDLGLGTIERGINAPEKYEVPAQKWANITDASGTFGMAIMNDCKYGWDKPDDNTLRLTLLHTPQTNNKRYTYQAVQDIGTHKFLYAVAGHKGSWQDGGIQWTAARLNQPLIAFAAPVHEGNLGKSLSMLQLSTPQVAVRAMKKAENSGEIIIRLQELDGKPVSGVIVSLNAPITSAREVNGAEDPIGPVQVKQGKIIVDMKANQPRTFALQLAAPKVRKTAPMSKSVDLPYDLAATTCDGETFTDSFDGEGNMIPAELFPARIVSDGVEFTLGPSGKGVKNMLACKGQTIRFDSKGNNSLYLLAASIDTDATGVFKVGEYEKSLPIQYCSGHIGQWTCPLKDGKVMNKEADFSPAYLKRAPVAWFVSHWHKQDGSNIAYKFCYLYRYRIDLPKGVGAITLPNDSRIRIAAMTLASNDNDQLRLASPGDEEVFGDGEQ